MVIYCLYFTTWAYTFSVFLSKALQHFDINIRAGFYISGTEDIYWDPWSLSSDISSPLDNRLIGNYINSFASRK